MVRRVGRVGLPARVVGHDHVLGAAGQAHEGDRHHHAQAQAIDHGSGWPRGRRCGDHTRLDVFKHQELSAIVPEADSPV